MHQAFRLRSAAEGRTGAPWIVLLAILFIVPIYNPLLGLAYAGCPLVWAVSDGCGRRCRKELRPQTTPCRQLLRARLFPLDRDVDLWLLRHACAPYAYPRQYPYTARHHDR